MAISPIMNNGMIQRTDDIGALKLQENTRPMVEQQNAQSQIAKRADEYSHQVVTPSDSNKADTHADAREEGKNKYFFQKKKTKNEKEENDGRVIKKYSSSSFDMKV